jgi:hypothetical protein
MWTAWLFLAVLLTSCGGGLKNMKGGFDRDDPADAPGDALEGPLGGTESPGLNGGASKKPARR